MGKREAANEQQLQEGLATLPGWTVEDGKLCKTFKFGSFAEALGWMVSAGVAADKMDHHPEWSNVYNRVSVSLVTHDLGNVISTYDLTLAQKMEELAGK